MFVKLDKVLSTWSSESSKIITLFNWNSIYSVRIVEIIVTEILTTSGRNFMCSYNLVNDNPVNLILFIHFWKKKNQHFIDLINIFIPNYKKNNDWVKVYTLT